mgnify:FL=1
MVIKITEELKVICRSIQKERKSLDEWRQASDTERYLSEHFIGGFDAELDLFSFLYYDRDENEFRFRLRMDEVELIVQGEKDSVQLITN